MHSAKVIDTIGHPLLIDAVSLAGLTPLHDVSRSISVIEWPPEMDDLGPFSELEETNILPLLWSIDHNVPEHLLGDITRLRQVLINLCTNSLKFTQRGRVSVRVSVHRPTPQYPTIRPNCTPTITRNSPQGSHIYSSYSEGPESSSLPSSPMLSSSDYRPPMVFQQRYDVRTEAGSPVHHKPSPAPSRRRQADKRFAPASVPAQTRESPTRQMTAVTVPSLTVVAPTANSLERDALDENSVILEFSVSDTGVGIPANKITELFTSFSQVDISVSTRFGGTGLGLAISASLVEKMGGNIWVESTEGVGSRFTFTIPFTICPSSETDSHPSATAPPSPVSAPIRRNTSMVDRHHCDRTYSPRGGCQASRSACDTSIQLWKANYALVRQGG
jgi:signal transduction histidine kinase